MIAFDVFNILNGVNYADFVGNLSSLFYGQEELLSPPGVAKCH